jgi:hypothetical protein
MAKNCLQTTRREKVCLNYYQKIVPTLYFDFFGILGTLKFLVFKLSDYLSLFIDKQEEVMNRSPKKCCISCTKLMISMAAVNYDTCPMEGFDSLRVKKY